MTAILETSASGQRVFRRYRRESTELAVDEWQRLQELAAELGVRNGGGSRIGAPSWRAMLREIAAGRLVVKWKHKRLSRA